MKSNQTDNKMIRKKSNQKKIGKANGLQKNVSKDRDAQKGGAEWIGCCNKGMEGKTRKRYGIWQYQ